MITSTGNGRVKQLIQWQKKRRAREESGIFLVEGPRMFAEAPREQVLEVWVSESVRRQKGEELRLDGWGDRLVEVSDAVFAHVSDTRTPQGILAVLRRAERSPESILDRPGPGEEPLLILLDGLQDPGNLGTILRAGEAAGATGVLLSADCVDIYNPKVIRATMGAIYRVPFAYVEDLPGTIRALEARGVGLYAAHLEASHSYEEADYRGGCGFLIGNEGSGLRPETAAAAGHRIRIPMCGQVESLNAAMAATVLLFEAARQRRRGE